MCVVEDEPKGGEREPKCSGRQRARAVRKVVTFCKGLSTLLKSAM